MKIAPIGQDVSLSLNTGEQLSGVVTELGIDHLLIDDACVVSLDSIVKITLISSSPKQSTTADGLLHATNDKSASLAMGHNNSTSQPPASDISVITPKTPLASANVPPTVEQSSASSTPSPEVMQKLFLVVERVCALVDTAKMGSPEEPDYKKNKENQPRQFFEKKSDWASIWNSYEYANRVRELEPKFHRTPNIASKAELLLAGVQPDPIIFSYVAYFNMLAERFDRAETLFKNAIALKSSATYWMGLAWIYFKQNKVLHLIYALENYFLMESPETNETAWYYYVGCLLSGAMSYSGVLRVLEKIDSVENCLLNTLVYFLYEQKNIPTALQLIEDSMCDSIQKTKLIQLLHSIEDKSDDDLALLAESFDEDLQTRRRNLNSDSSQMYFINDALHLEGKINNLFVNSSYGFITGKNGVHYHFYFSDIADIDLYYRISQRISDFRDIESLAFIPNKNYRGPKAANITPLVKRNLPISLKEYHSICSMIISNAENGIYNVAIYEAQKLQNILPEATYISRLIEIWQTNPPNTPKGNDSYRKAVRAKKRGDYEKAKSFFLQDISEKDNTDKAINELTSVLSNLYEFDQALDLIKRHENSVSDRNKLFNLTDWLISQ